MYFDFKITTWERITVPEEQEHIVSEKIQDGTIETGNDVFTFIQETTGFDLADREVLDETEESMTPEENGGCATVEIRSDKDELVWSNEIEIDPAPEFPNGFDDWQETHYHIVAAITEQQIKESWGCNYVGEVIVPSPALKDASTGELWEIAKDWTDQFEKEYQGREWDGDYFDTIEEFVNEKLFPNASN